MFFFFSKILTFFLSPLTWILLIFIFALITKRRKLKKTFLIIGISCLYFFSNEFICDEVYRKWEYPFTGIAETDTFDYAIVLGGFSSYDTVFSRVKFSDAADRFIQAYQLYQQGKVRKILLTGGSGSLLHQEETEADKIKIFLISLKVPAEDIIMEKASRNTHENALFTRDLLLRKDSSAKCLLITSATHMKRALGCYKKMGLSVTPYTTHRLTEPRKFDPGILFVPSSRAFNNWDIVIKEMAGIMVYKIVGYI